MKNKNVDEHRLVLHIIKLMINNLLLFYNLVTRLKSPISKKNYRLNFKTIIYLIHLSSVIKFISVFKKGR